MDVSKATTPHASLIGQAVKTALMSPCMKSKRGVVIFRARPEIFRMADILDVAGTCGLVYGFNHPPAGFQCERNDVCRAACSKVAVHAEQHALVRLREVGALRGRVEALHVKVVDGVLVAGGGPSCVECSKLLLEAGVSAMWLYEARPEGDTWVRYEMERFHFLSLEAHGLPRGLGMIATS